MLYKVAIKYGMAGEWGKPVFVSASSLQNAAQSVSDSFGFGPVQSYTSDTFRARTVEQGRIFYRYIHVKRAAKGEQ